MCTWDRECPCHTWPADDLDDLDDYEGDIEDDPDEWANTPYGYDPTLGRGEWVAS